MKKGLFANPIFRMGKVVHEFVHHANLELERCGCLSFSLFIILFRVKHCQPVSQKDLASETALSGAAISRQIKKLEEEGLIERHQGEDRRNQLITITKKGIASLDLCEEVVSPMLEKRLELLTFDQQKELSTILNTLTI